MFYTSKLDNIRDELCLHEIFQCNVHVQYI